MSYINMKNTLSATGGMTHFASQYSGGANIEIASGASMISVRLAAAIISIAEYTMGAISCGLRSLIFLYIHGPIVCVMAVLNMVIMTATE